MRSHKWLKRVGIVVAALLLAVFVVAAGALVYLSTPAGRSWLRARVNDALASSFRGTLVIEEIGRIALDGAAGVRLSMRHPNGEPVLYVDGASVRLPVLATAYRALTGRDLAIVIDEVAVAFADVSLERTPAGELRLAEAFEPPEPDREPGRPLRVRIERVHIEHAWAHGRFDGQWIDADIDQVAGRLEYTEDALALALDRAEISTRAAPRGADLDARVQGALTIAGETPAGELSLAGSAGGIPLIAEARIDGERIDGRLGLGPAQPAELQQLVPALDPRGSVALQGRFSGTLDALGIELDAQLLGPGDRLEGSLSAAARMRPSPLSVDATIELERLNLAELHRRAPQSRIAARGSLSSDGQAARFELVLGPSTVQDTTLAPARLSGRLEDRELTVTGRIGPERAAANIMLVADLEAQHARAQIRAHEVELSRLVRRDGTIVGTAAVDADVRASWATSPPTVSGRVRARARHMAVAGLYVGRAEIAGDARSAGGAPVVDVTLRAGSIAAGKTFVPRVEGRARGRLDALHARLEAEHDGRRLGASARVHIADGVRVEDLEVRGLGDPIRGAVRVHDRRTQLALRGQRIDVGALARIAGMRGVEGTATLDLDLTKTAQRIDGYVVAVLEDGRIGRLEKLDGHLDARIEGRSVASDAWLTWNDVGWVDVSLDAALRGPPASRAAWTGATGSLTVAAAGRVQQLTALERIGILAPGTLPFASLAGRVHLEATAERDNPQLPPDLAVTLETTGVALQATPKRVDRVAGRTVVSHPEWEVRGLDLRAIAAVDGATGDAELEARLHDARGPLAWIDVDAELPYRALWRHDLAGRPASEWLRRAPLHAWLSTAKRRWAELPSLLRTEHMQGDVQLSAWFEGTLEQPHASLMARSFGLETERIPLDFPVDAVVLAEWKDRRADAHVKLFAPRYQILDARARVDADLARVLTGRAQARPWRADARAELCDLPLEGIAMLAGRRMEGNVRGELVLEDLNLPTARLDAELRLDNLTVNDVRYPSGEVRVAMREGSLEAAATLRQADKGWGQARAAVPIRWTRAVPELATDGPATIVVRARNFRIAAVQPFVESIFVELDGRVNADARLALAHPPRLRGNLVLSDGRFQLGSFGERFFDTDARVRFTNEGTILLDSLTARSVGGRVEAKGRARFEGLRLREARLSLRVPRDRQIPVVIDGEQLARASGRVELAARPHDSGLRVDVKVPELHAMLAERSPNPVQKLQGARHVHVGTMQNGRFAELPLGPPPKARGNAASVGMPLYVAVSLGERVRIERERKLWVELSGDIQLEMTDRLRTAGAIVLERGYLEVQGRRFVVEDGTVTFSGHSPSNPDIAAIASWRAPDGTKVYAEYTGPVKSGKLSLRSDPPLSKDQILSLIVFGETDQTLGGSSEGRGTGIATQAAGIGGGVVAPGLNEAIDDLTGLDVRVKTGSSPTNDPTTELELLITHELSVQFEHVLGMPRPGASPDRNYGTVDWRFKHDWSIQTSIGDQGSASLELLWHHRY